MTRLSGGSQDRIHAKVHVRHHIAQQDDSHKLAGIGQCDIAGAKEAQDGVQEYQAYHHKQEADNQVQRHRIAQQMLGSPIVALPQFDTDTGRGTDADSRTKGT